MAAASLPTLATPSGKSGNYLDSLSASGPPRSCERIADEIEALLADHHRGVIVSGPAGSGKSSRLVRGLVAASWFGDRRLSMAARPGEKEPAVVPTSVERLGASIVAWHSLSAGDR
jgi:hypothetical protein